MGDAVRGATARLAQKAGMGELGLTSIVSRVFWW